MANRASGERDDGIFSDQPYWAMEHWESDAALETALSRAVDTLASPNSRTLGLRDRSTGAEVSFRDIGLGTSQMIPVLVSAVTSKNGIIAIEQPEIHLHPTLQAELGDLLIESALREGGNRFVIETHSEHLILRLLRRIRETASRTLLDGLCPISAEDIAILYVAPGKNGSIVQRIEVTERGRISGNWPGGFFEERLEELF